MSHFFWILITFIIALGILITVHEFGHFLAACFFKVKIERFSIGLGPILWRWRDSRNIEYAISAIPLGGYVKLFDVNTKNIDDNCYNNLFCFKNIWQRSIIIISGPMLNFIFSIILYTLVFFIGMPIYKPKIAYIFPNSITDQSCVLPGSEIKFINNTQVYDWDSARMQILNNINKTEIIISTISTSNMNVENHTLYLPHDWINNTVINIHDPLIALGIFPNILFVKSITSKMETNYYDIYNSDSLQVGDKILLINGQPIYNCKLFEQMITKNLKKTFQITIERNKRILDLHVVLNKEFLINSKEIIISANSNIKFVIAQMIQNPEIYQCTLYLAIVRSFNKTWQLISFISHTLFQLIIGDININSLHGPIAIAKGAGESAHFGLLYYLMFLAMVSINLGVVNLLPFPIVDGGQLLFLLIEKITGKPISEKRQHFLYITSFIILIFLMCFVIYNDIANL